MSDSQKLQPEQEEELTAYLDGELDAESVRRVEQRLAQDEAYRANLQKLEHAWNLLERLPRAAVSEQFTKTTLEMVAVSAAQEAAEVQQQLPRLRKKQRLAGLVSMAAALLVGLAIGNQVWPDPNEKLLQDLPVLENLDLFYQVENVEFLRLLDERHLFDEGDSGDERGREHGK